MDSDTAMCSDKYRGSYDMMESFSGLAPDYRLSLPNEATETGGQMLDRHNIFKNVQPDSPFQSHFCL